MDSISLKVSVITICMNCVDEIVLTLDSVITQTYKNIEYIVIDGGSVDGTLEYLNSRKEKLAILISEPDKGIYDAMNKGIMVATGCYLIFMNAGDRFASRDVLQKLMTDSSILEESPEIISGKIQFEYKGKLLNLFGPAKDGRDGFGLPHQATFISVNLQKENLFDTRYRFMGDHELWRRLQSKGLLSKVKYIDDIISVFAFGGASNNPKNDMKRYLERVYVDYLYSNRFGLREYCTLFFKPTVRYVIYNLLGKERFYKFLRFAKALGFRSN